MSHPVHRALTGVHYSNRARCGAAHTDGGCCPVLLITNDPDRVTCPACRHPLRHWVGEQVQMLAVLVMALGFGAIALPGELVQRIRSRGRRPEVRSAVLGTDAGEGHP